MNHKITIITILLLLLALPLAACGGTSTQSAQAVEAEGTPMPDETVTTGNSTSESMQLALGILSLQNSEVPLTVEQAATLLPLWKAVRSLGESDTAAQAEIDALYTQIRSLLTEEQQAAVDGMSFDRESMAALSQELGIEMGFGGMGMGGTPSPEMQSTLEAMRASGQMPEMPEGGFGGEGREWPEMPAGGAGGGGGGMPSGGMPGGGGGMPGGDMGGMDFSAMATQQASGMVTAPSLNNTINGPWLEALIAMLEEIAAG